MTVLQEGDELCGELGQRFFEEYEVPASLPPLYSTIGWIRRWQAWWKRNGVEYLPDWVLDRVDACARRLRAEGTFKGDIEVVVGLGAGLSKEPFYGSRKLMKAREGNRRAFILCGHYPRAFFVCAWDAMSEQEIELSL